ncbi:unnamed protein product [Rhizoctonia solani]|uniref:Zn(2)-C6 fungal-type domain-containing protein n=1 Tax=Rhizoctonia solani TaxID=456999 RepID=A0A8H3E5X7_9AGAM|nr:unnamed protein product [Rhizoctonia solani]
MSRDSCSTCVVRRRKCDGARPICRHCIRDKIECGGYSNVSNARNHIRGLSNPRIPQTALPNSTIGIIDLASLGVLPASHHYGPIWGPNISSSEPTTPAEWSNTGHFSSLVSNVGSTYDPPRSVPPTPILRQAPTPPYYPTDSGFFDEVTHDFLPPKKDVRQSMTPGQASLFDALLSLARPGDDLGTFGRSSSLRRTPMGPMPAEPPYVTHGADQAERRLDQAEPEDLHDAQIVAAKLCNPLALDKKVKSNMLPFFLQSYALWMRQFLFEPVRIIPLAREYILEEYSEGPAARWRMMAISNAVRTITGSTGYTLEDFEVLEPHMYQDLARVTPRGGENQAADRVEALLAMSTTYEFISVALKVFPLSKVVKAMQVVSPIFRRACPDPENIPINLPNLLSNINVGLEYFAMLDVLLSAVINRPMNFRYDTTFVLGVYASVFDLEQGPGTRWVYGVPDRLVITFARMNTLLEDFGPSVDPRVIEELEAEIREVKPIVIASAYPSLAVGRLVVQECWRQAAYIYLYMGLCGADSHDARVIKAHDDFMEVFIRTKPARIPDSFLVLPLPIIGIAARRPSDQRLLASRMLALPECARKGTTGNQFIRMLECIWGLVNESGRPSTWSDLRLASLYVAGV